MANSQELRVPFLDHKVVEFAAGLPAALKVKGKSLKHILKKATESVVPNEILLQKKIGFAPPISHWITSELSKAAN